jgi:hypothetical protein
MPYLVKQLLEGRGLPISVYKPDPVADALSQMIENDYSQLPVVNEERYPLGIVTYESILRAMRYFRLGLDKLHVQDVMTSVPHYSLEDDLFDLLDRLKNTNAVLIVDPEEKLVGIVTSYDSTEYFRNRAENLMRVEDIETTIKDIIRAAYANEQNEVDETRLEAAVLSAFNLSQSPNFKTKTFDALSLGQYITMLTGKDTWKFVESILGIPKEALITLLNDVRETRNDLAHFRKDITTQQRDQLIYCAGWLALRQETYQERRREELIRSRESKTPIEQVAVTEQFTGIHSGEEIQIIAEETIPKDSRYAPLADWLQSQPGKIDTVTLTFNQIEEIIRGELPPSARNHRVWWANDAVGHVQARMWLDIGWRSTYINMTEGRVTFTRIKEREKAYIDFYSALLTDLWKKTKFPPKSVSPDGASWIWIGGVPEKPPQFASFSYSFSRDKRFRVELYIDAYDRDKNKKIFDMLAAQRTDLEKELGPISWERIDDKRASRIALYHAGSITDSAAELARLRQWGVEMMGRFYQALAGRAEAAILEVMKS